ncbi:MAG: AAA family ATPase, partial [Saprospiraceae bacterium]|nr:AAA family ATPase [Saprospiraceae bacterium]
LLKFLIDKIRREPVSLKGTLNDRDIRNGTKEAVNTLTIYFEKEHSEAPRQKGSSESDEANIETGVELTWYGSLTKSGFEPDEITEASAFTDFDNIISAIDKQLKREEPSSLPVLVYYRCDYATDTPAANGEMISTEAFNAYDHALSTRSFDFRQFSEWYKWREDLARDTKNGRDRLREITEQAVCTLLSDKKNKFTLLRTKALTTGIGYELTVSKNGDPLSVNQFSSGERMLFALVADLARRLALANPGVEKPLEGNGIVLIDEIDLHLHPGKQQEVLPKLLEIFPNVQFVVTTHSPVAINNLDPEKSSVYMLNDTSTVQLEHFAGRNIAELMYEYYGIKSRPEGVQKDIDELFSLIESEDPKQIKQAKTMLNRLKKRLGEEDSAVMDAANSIELLEEIL